MPKTNVVGCGSCNKVAEIIIVWLKSGDTEVTCLDCHMAMVLSMVAEQTEIPAAGEPVATA